MRAYYSMKSKLGALFGKHDVTTLHLFDSLIEPILLYSSDYWGCLKLPKKNPIKTFLFKFLKELLGVQKQTSRRPTRARYGINKYLRKEKLY